MDTEKEIERLDKRIDEVEEAQEEQGKLLRSVVKDVLKFWHIGIGVAAGLMIDKFGLEKLLTKFL